MIIKWDVGVKKKNNENRMGGRNAEDNIQFKRTEDSMIWACNEEIRLGKHKSSSRVRCNCKKTERMSFEETTVG